MYKNVYFSKLKEQKIFERAASLKVNKKKKGRREKNRIFGVRESGKRMKEHADF